MAHSQPQQVRGETGTVINLPIGNTPRPLSSPNEHFRMDWFCISAALSGALVVGLFAVVKVYFDLHKTLPRQVEKVEFCCPEVVMWLVSFANHSSDPCTNFLEFACHSREVLKDGGVVQQRFLSAVLYPTIQGTLKSPASNLLYSFYKSCLVASSDKGFAMERIVLDVLEIFRKWSGANDVDAVKVIGVLHIKLYIKLLFELELVLQTAKRPSFMEISPRFPERNYGDFDYEERATFEAKSLWTLSKALSSRLEIRDVDAVHDELLAAFDTEVEENRSGSISSVDEEVFGKPTFFKWRSALDEVCSCSDKLTIRVENYVVVKRIIAIFESSSYHLHGIAYLVLVTAANLFSFQYMNGSTASDVSSVRYCNGEMENYFKLWDIVSVEQLTSPEKDAEIRIIYASVVDAVIAVAEAEFESKVDVSELHGLLSQMHLKLPAEVTSAYISFIPNTSTSFVANLITIRGFIRQSDLVDSSIGLEKFWSSRSNAYEVDIIPTEEYIVLSPTVYPQLQLKAGAKSFINMALLGVQLSNLFWEIIFAHQGWTPGLQKQLVNYENCLEHHVFAEDASDLRYPLLSVRSAALASSRQGWHDPIGSWGLWRLSPSQVFYMLFFVNEVCTPGVLKERPLLLSRSTSFMLRIVDFRAAFHCKSSLNATNGGCF